MNLSRLAKDLKPYVIPWIVDAIDNVVVNVTYETGGGGSTGVSYTAGDGVDIASSVISADVTDFIDTDYGLTESSNNIRISLAATSGLEFSTGALQVADEIAGAGLAISSKVLAVNVGDGLEIDSDAVVVDVTDIIDTSFGLAEVANRMRVKVAAAGGVDFDASGGLQIDVTDIFNSSYGLSEYFGNLIINLPTNSGLGVSSSGLALGTPTTRMTGRPIIVRYCEAAQRAA